jgi:hypothetical protein
MWYTVESDKSTIRNEGELGCKLTYKNLSEMFQLPSFDALTVGVSGDHSGLMAWAEDTHVKVLPFTFEKDKRVMFELVPKDKNIVVGTVWYGTSKTISATFSRTSDARDILEMFYPHWLISYGELDSAYTRKSIREIVGNL